jgi:hypothetical protein
LVEIELLVETGRTDDAHQALRDLHADQSYIAYYQANELTALGFPDEALAALNDNANLLPKRDGFALLLDALIAKGRFGIVYNEVQEVLHAPSSVPAVEILCTQFIRHPDPGLLAALFEKLQREPLPPAADTYQATVALFFAAGANTDWPHVQVARNWLRQLGLPTSSDLDLAEAFFRGQSDQQRLGGILPLFQPPPFEISSATTNGSLSSPVMIQPLALDVTYALYEHYSGKPRAPTR